MYLKIASDSSEKIPDVIPETEKLIKGKTEDGKEVVIAHVRSAYDEPEPKAAEPKKASPKPAEKPAKAEVKQPQPVEKPKAEASKAPKPKDVIVPVKTGTELPWKGELASIELLTKTAETIWAADGEIFAGNKTRIVKVIDHPEIPDGGYSVIAGKKGEPILKYQEALGAKVGKLIEQMKLDEMTVWMKELKVDFSSENSLYPELLKLLRWFPSIPADADVDAIIDSFGSYTVGADKREAFFRTAFNSDKVFITVRL